MFNTQSVCSALLITDEVEHLYRKAVRTKTLLYISIL